MFIQEKKALRQMLDAAIASAQPELCLPRFIPKPVKGKTVVIGAGKASAQMARTFEQHFSGDLSGLVATQYGYAVSCDNIEIIEAAHPTPDESSFQAAKRMLGIVKKLGKNDQLICLISGGGSSLISHPAAGITLEEKQQIGQTLLDAGARISEINCVRRHLSAIKGGHLAKLCPLSRTVSLLISDVPGDDPINIASGPSVADPSTCADALKVLNKYQIPISKPIRNLLLNAKVETIKPDDACFENNAVHLIATPQLALETAALCAKNLGIHSDILSDRLEGEARSVGVMLAGVGQQELAKIKQGNAPKPRVILSGGETTVTVKGNGSGGRNVELLLAMAIAFKGQENIFALAADTDGIDGKAPIAGAIITPNTLKRAAALGLNPLQYLKNNDAHTFFTALGDSIITGPTFTNVNDFRAMLIL